ncbi:two-component system chemotaxis response regulator CheB [Silvimonas terrae]|uniref:protein-glutamate methylesterase n=1 Tax=Silvimonas terrae TaxID=300266 RepID=A0A840RAI3_9NEIS|nr:chemotaxis protein CheB [Silvimonas terrae]MBB5189362.1 two-component system chemotaxis response regulator CheB [Silvimonas terrae]
MRLQPRDTRHLPPTVLIGGSAGSVEALGLILPALPADLGAAVVIVVHLPSSSPSLLVDIFAPRMALPVAEVHDKVQLKAGRVYFAPPDYHVLVEPEGQLTLNDDPPVHFCRPAIDLLFESGADALGKRAVGVLLTGANQDGAAGMAALVAAGATTIVQDPADAQAPFMPASALRQTTVELILPAREIGPALAAHAYG